MTGSDPPGDAREGPSQALVVAGHGSLLDPDSAEPVAGHAAAIRRSGPFDEVTTAFWKEEPTLGEALRTTRSDRVYVVPLFTSEGYFVEEVLPRELRLAGDRPLDVDATVALAEPVGSHPAMTDVVASRAESATGDGVDPAEVGVAVVGHGTERNEHSARSTRRHARRLRESGRYAEVRPLFLDEEPRVSGLADAFGTPEIAVVPLFVADGHHVTRDLPAAIGLPDADGPATVDGHRVWYAGAVGTDPGVADLLVERAVEAGADPGPATDRRSDPGSTADGQSARVSNPRRDPRDHDDAGRAFLRWVEDADGGARTWGELSVEATPGPAGRRRYRLRHRSDRAAPVADLDRLDGPGALRRLARLDADGRYRPLKGAPTLRAGWLLADLDGRALLRAVGHVYPATVENWHREREGRLDVTHFRDAAGRQTGIYEPLADLDGEVLAGVVEACCAGCAKRRTWEERPGEPIAAPRGDGRPPCREPCAFLLDAARVLRDCEPAAADLSTDEGPAAGGEPADGTAADGEPADDEATDDGATVPVAAFDEPANPYRRRYLAARARGGDRPERHRGETA